MSSSSFFWGFPVWVRGLGIWSEHQVRVLGPGTWSGNSDRVPGPCTRCNYPDRVPGLEPPSRYTVQILGPGTRCQHQDRVRVQAFSFTSPTSLGEVVRKGTEQKQMSCWFTLNYMITVNVIYMDSVSPTTWSALMLKNGVFLSMNL